MVDNNGNLLIARQVECMPLLGHYGHLGQWVGGQSNCPPPPHGHCKHQGQWVASYQGQWNNCCEGMATNHHGHANWDALVEIGQNVTTIFVTACDY